MPSTRTAGLNKAKPPAKKTSIKQNSVAANKKEAGVKAAAKKNSKVSARASAVGSSSSKKPSTPAKIQAPTPPTTPRKTVNKRPLHNQEASSPSPASKKSKSTGRDRTNTETKENKDVSKKGKDSDQPSKTNSKKLKDEPTNSDDKMVYLCDLIQTSIPSPKKDETLLRNLMKSDFMKGSYRNLPNLLAAHVDHTRYNEIEFWTPDQNLSVNKVIKELYRSALDFSRSGRFVNLSRIDPQHLTVAKDSLLVIDPTANQRIAYCVSTITVDQCNLITPADLGGDASRKIKTISGHPDEYEWNRLEACLYMVYHIRDYSFRVYSKCVQFGTMPSSPTGGTNTLPFIKKEGSLKSPGSKDSKARVEAIRARAGKKSTDSLGKGDRVLSCEDHVHIYDGRSAGSELFDNLESVHANLRELDYDLMFGDVAMVVYTVNKYGVEPGYMALNVCFVILIGSSDDQSSAPADSGAPLLPPFHLAYNDHRPYAFLANLDTEGVDAEELDSFKEHLGSDVGTDVLSDVDLSGSEAKVDADSDAVTEVEESGAEESPEE